MSYTKKELIQAYKDLRRSRKYIQHNWIKGAYGKNRATGRSYDRHELYENATHMCSLGAIGRVAHVTGHKASERTSAKFLACSIERLDSRQPGRDTAANTIVSYNDATAQGDHKVVLEAWDEAIKTVRGALVGMIRNPDKDQ